MQAILAFLAVLPKIISLIERLGELMEKNRVSEWLDDVDASIDALEKAQTPEAKRDAAKKIALVIRRARR